MRISPDELEVESPLQSFLDRIDTDAEPPTTRALCISGERPCKYVRCKFHIWAERLRGFAARDLRKDAVCTVFVATTLTCPSCLLDVIDERGELCIDDIGDLLGVPEHKIDAIMSNVLTRLRRQALVRSSSLLEFNVE